VDVFIKIVFVKPEENGVNIFTKNFGKVRRLVIIPRERSNVQIIITSKNMETNKSHNCFIFNGDNILLTVSS